MEASEAPRRRIVLRPDAELTEAIDVAAARARKSAPELVLEIVATQAPVAAELASVRARKGVFQS